MLIGDFYFSEEQQKLKTPEKLNVLGFSPEPSRSSSSVVQEEYVPERDVSEVLKQHKEVKTQFCDVILALTSYIFCNLQWTNLCNGHS